MKREKTERTPIPEDTTERFMGIVYSMIEPFGIDKIPEVMHYVELLGQAVDRQIFEASHVSTDRRASTERKRFITIFKTRYLHYSDMEYSRPITPAEAKLIGQVIDMIGSKGFDVDEFLQWLFDVFFDENPKFNPPSIKFSCSQFIVEKFLFEHREEMKKKKQDDIVKKDALDVIGRSRVLMRMAKEEGNQQTLDFIIDLLKRYRDGSIMLGDLRIEVEKLEAIINAKKVEGEVVINETE